MTIFSKKHLADNIDLFQRWVNRQLLDRSLPSMSVALIHDQQVIWKGGFGYADIQMNIPSGADTVYEIGSITKVFTAIAILQLCDQRKIDLDRQVIDYLPWFGILPFEGRPSNITIRHLLLHTSGLPPNLVVPGSGNGSTPTLEELKEYLPRHECVAALGGEPQYSNLGYILLGQIIEQVSGLNYANYIKNNIFSLLNMTQSTVGHVRSSKSVAKGYGRYLPYVGRKNLAPVDMHTAESAGGIATTLEDLAKFAMFYFRAEENDSLPILSKKTSMMMLSPSRKLEEGQIEQSIAWRIGCRDGCIFVRHSGTVAGFQCGIELLPEQKIGMIVLTNAIDGDAFHFLYRLYDWVVKAILNPTEIIISSPTSSSYSAYIGKYRSVWSDIELFVFQGRLALIHPSAPSPIVIFLDDIDGKVFKVRVPTNPLCKDLAEFNINTAGNVDAMLLGGVSFDRIANW